MQANTVILVLCLVAAAGLLVSTWQMMRRRPRGRGFARPGQAVDISRYRPMLRLLSANDLEFPFMAAPVAGDIAVRLRRQRLAIFRSYLRAMRSDFDALQDAGHQLIAAGRPSAGLAESLFRSKTEFTRSMWILQFRLIAFQFGWMSVDVRPLLTALQRTQLALQPSAA